MQKHATQDSVTLLYKLTIFRIILEAISIYFANWTTTDLLADYYGGGVEWRGRKKLQARQLRMTGNSFSKDINFFYNSIPFLEVVLRRIQNTKLQEHSKFSLIFTALT